MDNKLSEQQIAAYRDRLAASDSEYEMVPVATRDLRALLAEHEASQEALKNVTELWNEQRQRIVDLEAGEKILESATLKHLERAEEAEKRLATPVRLMGEMLLHDWEHSVERQAAFQHRKTAWDTRLEEDKKAIRAAGFTFTVEGDGE